MILHIKLQASCLLVLLYIAFIYFKGKRKYNQKSENIYFDVLLLFSIINVVLDGTTACTVNYQEFVSPVVNLILHALFLVSVDTCIFSAFIYLLNITGAVPKRKWARVIVFVPFVLNILIVILNIGSLEYRTGTITNYSMGISAYTCFSMVAVYIILSIVTYIRKRKRIAGGNGKRSSIFTFIMVLTIITSIQMIYPEVLISSLAITIFAVGVYMNLEDPALKELERYHHEMIMGFATLIENRDDSTGGHIKRTSAYVKLIAKELRRNGCYGEVLTDDYIQNLVQAAPMHDIGKISVPDAILQKPGKLTDEEFTVMKQHTENGSKIVMDTFKTLLSDEAYRITYDIARYHHEKWNGKGYPKGLQQEEIPLCARIMAVADVFDAVSEKRCYRDAMPIEQCFKIIEQGKGTDFEPAIVEAFMGIRDKVEKVHDEFQKVDL